MQRSLPVIHFQSEPVLVQRKSNLIKELIALTVILPQALAFAAASGVEPKAELYTTVIAGSVFMAWAVARRLQGAYLKKNSKV